jgi:hypothetical protein
MENYVYSQAATTIGPTPAPVGTTTLAPTTPPPVTTTVAPTTPLPVTTTSMPTTPLPVTTTVAPTTPPPCGYCLWGRINGFEPWVLWYNGCLGSGTCGSCESPPQSSSTNPESDAFKAGTWITKCSGGTDDNAFDTISDCAGCWWAWGTNGWAKQDSSFFGDNKKISFSCNYDTGGNKVDPLCPGDCPKPNDDEFKIYGRRFAQTSCTEPTTTPSPDKYKEKECAGCSWVARFDKSGSINFEIKSNLCWTKNADGTQRFCMHMCGQNCVHPLTQYINDPDLLNAYANQSLNDKNFSFKTDCETGPTSLNLATPSMPSAGGELCSGECLCTWNGTSWNCIPSTGSPCGPNCKCESPNCKGNMNGETIFYSCQPIAGGAPKSMTNAQRAIEGAATEGIIGGMDTAIVNGYSIQVSTYTTYVNSSGQIKILSIEDGKVQDLTILNPLLSTGNVVISDNIVD